MKTSQQRSRQRCIIGGCVLLGLLVFAYFVGGHSDKPRESEVISLAKKDILDRLKTPRTAEFGDIIVVDSGDGEYYVLGWVEAQNAFGTMIRSNFSVTVKKSGRNPLQCTDVQIY